MKRERWAQIGMFINGLSIALFIFLANILDVPTAPPVFIYLAWVLLGVGVSLIILSTATLMSKRRSGLINWGIYGVVRHPMYLGAALLFLSWIGFMPHWIVILIALTNIAIVYWFMLEGERQNIAKFGDQYRIYMSRVPRVDFLTGIFRVFVGK
ncbi:MAG: methyltransferase [Anaerolineales bacterium]|jgi:protein-S-isoprenylcysteine O-methyltransferase Ste14